MLETVQLSLNALLEKYCHRNVGVAFCSVIVAKGLNSKGVPIYPRNSSLTIQLLKSIRVLMALIDASNSRVGSL